MDNTKIHNDKYRLYKAVTSREPILIKVGDDDTAQTFRNRAGNKDLLISTWFSAIPDISSLRIYFIVFFIISNNIETARVSALEVIYYIEETFGIPAENIEIIFNCGGNRNGDARDGIAAAEFIILVQPAIFDGLPTPLMPALNYYLAQQMTNYGIKNIDIDVYQRDHFIPLINSINSTTGRFVISLTPKELLYMDGTHIAELSRQPRPDDSMIEPSTIPEAGEWFAETHAEFEKKVLRQDELQKLILSQGWEIPPCIRRWLRLSLYDNVRLEIYRIISQFFSWIGASESEIRYQIQNIDNRNPIDSYLKLNAIITFGVENGWFVGCQHPLLQKFCPGRCFISEIIKEYEQPNLFR